LVKICENINNGRTGPTYGENTKRELNPTKKNVYKKGNGSARGGNVLPWG